jgi:DNA-binding beta-propeller fold protein YncE
VVGHVYVNDNTAGTNTIGAFDRHANGSLTPQAGSPFGAGGAGTGKGLASQGALQISPGGRFLIAVDAGSNQVSVLRIRADGSLRLVPGGVVSSGGVLPVSVAIHGDLVYVANAGAGSGTVSRYAITRGGALRLLGSSRVGPNPAVGAVDARLSPGGSNLYVDESAASAMAEFAVHGGRLTLLPGSPAALPAGAAPAGIVVT